MDCKRSCKDAVSAWFPRACTCRARDRVSVTVALVEVSPSFTVPPPDRVAPVTSVSMMATMALVSSKASPV